MNLERQLTLIAGPYGAIGHQKNTDPANNNI